jgi:hypothetical protein
VPFRPIETIGELGAKQTAILPLLSLFFMSGVGG